MMDTRPRKQPAQPTVGQRAQKQELQAKSKNSGPDYLLYLSMWKVLLQRDFSFVR